MMLGFGYLQIWSTISRRRAAKRNNEEMRFNAFKEIQRVEWDTLLFFFGIILAVGWARRRWGIWR